jgi:hypothetical protein
MMVALIVPVSVVFTLFMVLLAFLFRFKVHQMLSDDLNIAQFFY